jgi:hypothetical protein
MQDQNYFNITENAKNYPLNAWTDSDDVLMYGVPTDGGFSIMTMAEAMAFISNNDAGSMVALRLTKVDMSLLQDAEHVEEFGFMIEDRHFVDYKGENLI